MVKVVIEIAAFCTALQVNVNTDGRTNREIVDDVDDILIQIPRIQALRDSEYGGQLEMYIDDLIIYREVFSSRLKGTCDEVEMLNRLKMSLVVAGV